MDPEMPRRGEPAVVAAPSPRAADPLPPPGRTASPTANPPFDHEEVIVKRGPRSGLPLIIAVHSRALGPAIGGCRMRGYDGWSAGLADALRLSEAMTYKAAVAGLSYGGGKSVIVLSQGTRPTPALRAAALQDLGEIIAGLGGSYRTGPDIGTGPADMAVLRRFSPHAYCTPIEDGGIGDSSGPTAAGVLAALHAGARHVFGDASFADRSVVVSGFGSVGSAVAAGLAAEGARVSVSDVRHALRGQALARGFGWLEPDAALYEPTDILVPAAVGGILDASSATRISAGLIIGPANNQLAHESVADVLAERKITWVPDYVASAGGIIYVISREAEGYSHDAAWQRVDEIGNTVAAVLNEASSKGVTPLAAARRIAEARLATAGTAAEGR